MKKAFDVLKVLLSNAQSIEGIPLAMLTGVQRAEVVLPGNLSKALSKLLW